MDRKLLEVTVCKPESWECAQLIRIDSSTRSSTRRLSDKTRGGGSEGGREGKGHVSYAALFLPLPLSPPPPRIRRTYFGRHASEPEIRTACAAYSLLASQHLDPLPLGNIILSALQKDGERGTKLQPVAFCYGIHRMNKGLCQHQPRILNRRKRATEHYTQINVMICDLLTKG